MSLSVVALEPPRRGPARRAVAGRLTLAGLLLLAGCNGRPEGAAGSAGEEAAAPAPAAAPTAAPAGSPENLLLITVDTLRADALGFAGNTEVATPALDRLAAAGRVYTDAHAQNVVTLPSHTNILTGLYPYQHGVRNNGGFKLGPDVPTLATVLHRAGFATAAVVGSFVLDSRYGLDRGFDVYDDDFGGEKEGEGEHLFTYPERAGSEVVARGSRWWHENSGRHRFLWLHLFDPHAPYTPPAPFAGKYSQPYLGEVAAVDSYLAPLLEGFLSGREAPTLVIFTADHGEALGEHGELTHSFFAYEPTLKVPMVLWGPGVEPGRDDRPAQHVDLMPTALGLLGVAPPAGLPGRSLLGPPDRSRTVYFESLSPNLEYGAAPLRGVIRNHMKLIELPIPELYDLAADPGESRNLFRDRPREAHELAAALPKESVWPPAPGAIAPDEAKELQSLGYLGTTAPRKAAYGPGDDPKNLIGLDRKLNSMVQLYTRGMYDEAVRLGREIVAARPTMTVAYEYLTRILLQRNDNAQALELLETARRAGAANAALRQQLGLSLVRAGRPAEAVKVLEEVDPDASDADTENGLALAYTALGRYEEATSVLEKAVAARPQDPRPLETLSFVAIQRERYGEARDDARRALEIDGRRPNAWNNLAIAYYNLGDPKTAVEAWKRAATLDPSNLDVLFNLGSVAARIGDSDTAHKALGRFLATAPASGYAAERREAQRILGGAGS